MHIESIPGIRWGEDAGDGEIVIDVAELCAWVGVPCDAENVYMIRAVVAEALLLLSREVTVELGACYLEAEGVSA